MGQKWPKAEAPTPAGPIHGTNPVCGAGAPFFGAVTIPKMAAPIPAAPITLPATVSPSVRFHFACSASACAGV